MDRQGIRPTSSSSALSAPGPLLKCSSPNNTSGRRGHPNKPLVGDPGGAPEGQRSEKREDLRISPDLRIVGVISGSDGKRQFLVESREGAKVKAFMLASAAWSQTESGYELVYKGQRVTESEMIGRSSNLVGHAAAPDVDFKVPQSPN